MWKITLQYADEDHRGKPGGIRAVVAGATNLQPDYGFHELKKGYLKENYKFYKLSDYVSNSSRAY